MTKYTLTFAMEKNHVPLDCDIISIFL